MKKNRRSKIQPKKSTPPISEEKKRLFYLFALLIPLLFFALLEIGLRIFDYGGNTDLFVSAPTEDSQYYGINRNIGRRYFFMQFTPPLPRKDLFLKEKPANGYRIFVLGGSTTAGYPYGNNGMFTRILHRRLSDTFPDRHIEVINTAMSAVNTYTLWDYMDEILAQKPDALLIYAGHNEFYGALGVASVESLGKYPGIVKTYLKLQRYKIFVLLRDIIGNIKKWLGTGFAPEQGTNPTATMMERIVREQTIPFGSSLYEAGKKQFRQNLRDIIKKAREAGLPVVVSELVSNIRDQQPFISVEADTFPPAREIFHAARTLEKSGQYQAARKAYYRAKDLDALRFRATEEFNAIIHEVAAAFDIPVVPMTSRFEAASPHGLIGNNLMHEHLHPKIDGYFLMADAFYNTMRQASLISPHWEPRYIKPAAYYRENWGFTELDSVYAALSILQLKGGWPFKNNHGQNLALYHYKPKTKVDSVALDILKTGRITLEKGHMELANYYGRRGEPERAFAEYKALIYTVPTEDLFYENAAKALIEMQQYERALPILNEAIKYNENNFFAHKWIGQILLIQGQYEQGIPYLEKARTLKPADSQLLYNLSRAYFKIAQPQKANEVLNLLKKFSPGSPFISRLEAFNTAANMESSDIEDYMKKAQQYLQVKQYDQALTILRQSLKVQETALAHKLIGTLLLASGKRKKAISSLERAREIDVKDDPKLLYNLSSAYYTDSQYQKAWEIYQRLKEIAPDFSDPGNLEEKLKKALQK